jgi:pimeloyl-ACP methyl ester carboxylesterase
MFIERGGVKLSYREEGAGEPPIVFIHGGAVDHSTWDEHMAHFAPRHRVVAMDLRGHGQSDKVGPLTSDTFREDLAALIDQLGLAPAVVIGASRRGGIATRVAVDYPGRVKALVLIDCDCVMRGRSELALCPTRAVRPVDQQPLLGQTVLVKLSVRFGLVARS